MRACTRASRRQQQQPNRSACWRSVPVLTTRPLPWTAVNRSGDVIVMSSGSRSSGVRPVRVSRRRLHVRGQPHSLRAMFAGEAPPPLHIRITFPDTSSFDVAAQVRCVFVSLARLVHPAACSPCPLSLSLSFCAAVDPRQRTHEAMRSFSPVDGHPVLWPSLCRSRRRLLVD